MRALFIGRLPHAAFQAVEEVEGLATAPARWLPPRATLRLGIVGPLDIFREVECSLLDGPHIALGPAGDGFKPANLRHARAGRTTNKLINRDTGRKDDASHHGSCKWQGFGENARVRRMSIFCWVRLKHLIGHQSHK